MRGMARSKAASQTMRIDIAPETAAPALLDKQAASAAGGSTFVARRQARVDRDTPYDKLLASVYDAVLITDLQGTILDFNGRALEFFRLDEKRLAGMSILDLISGADESLIATLRRNLEARTYTVIEARCTRADGTTFPAEIAVNRANLDEEGQLCLFIRDISVRMRAQQELENAIERLQALDRDRMEFVSNVSHELRTPLTSMIYAVKNMRRGVAGPLPEKAMQYLERLEADCRRLLATVNDILDLRQIENRTLTLARMRLPLARLVRTGVDALQVQAEEKGVALRLGPRMRPCFVLGDPHKLERVILNIAGNAIKFTPAGGVVEVELDTIEDERRQAVIVVRDTGVGIPPEVLDRVVQRYYKVGEQPIGSGLGLSIARELVTLHGGTMKIESPVPATGRGTQVSVFLPLTEAPLVLAAAGDTAFRERLARLIAAHGYRVVTAAGAQAALDLCAAQPPDVVVTDLALPDLPGTELALRLRNDRRHARLPIILVAGETLTRAQSDMLEGFQIPWLGKPLREEDLIARLDAVFFDRGTLGGI